jgi:hypothetical protein
MHQVSRSDPGFAGAATPAAISFRPAKLEEIVPAGLLGSEEPVELG